ncbi:MAG: hypothetical protein QQN41_09300 [Nitrosopumilus sp.]
MIKRICQTCGKEYFSQNKYCCSRKCADKWHSIQLTDRPLSDIHKKAIGQGNKGIVRWDLKAKWAEFNRTKREEDRPIPSKKPELIEYTCEWCSIKWLTEKQGICKAKQRHFCCDLHRNLWRSNGMSGAKNYFYGKNLSGKRASNWQGGDVQYICLHCGKEFHDNRNRKEKANNLFCSVECYHEWCSGKNNYAWQGGISFEPYGIEFNNELREQIRKKDNYTCQLCGVLQNGKRLAIHHEDYNKQNNNLSNLITLCSICHSKTNTNRRYWKKYFTENIKRGEVTCQ